MSTVMQLPERPNFEQLRKRARDISREFGIPLNEAQFNVARGYGFASWPKLKQHVEMVTALTREPDTAPAEDFLALVCLTYGDDPPSRIERGVSLVVRDPQLATRDIWSAAACARVDVVTEHIADASKQGGPFQWEPLMYLCYSRVPAAEADVLATAAALLDAGADPNVGYLFHGFPVPFTALAGVLGNGEGNQPPHQHWKVLARLLLERGADPNDAQALYNRQFSANNEHLELLFEFGLGAGDGGPWRKRMGPQLETVTESVQRQLRWAIHHGMLARVRLMCERGVDLSTPFDGQPSWAGLAAGYTPVEFAALCGHQEIVDELVKHGAARPELSPIDAYVGAVLGGGDTERIVGAHPDAVREARELRPSLVVQAAATRRENAVIRAVMDGFDVNALGRADAPVEQPWQTALHTAVERNDVAMVRRLLQLGADPTIEDTRFHGTPLNWAEHFGHTEVAAVLTS